MPSDPHGGNPKAGPRPRPVTAAYLERAALAYLERYASSAENLRRVLTRKVGKRCRLREEDPETFRPLVEEAVEKTLRGGLVDDRAYAEGRIATLRRRGGSARLIAARLKAKGVEREVVEAALAGEDEDELSAARAYARRRRLGPYRDASRAAAREPQAWREKDLAALARAGFSFDLARRVLDEEPAWPGAG